MKNYPNRKRLLKMIRSYVSGHASQTEIDFLHAYYRYFEQDNFADHLKEEELRLMQPEMISETWAKINDQKENVIIEIRRKSLWTQIAAAAVILISLSVGVYHLFYKKQGNQQTAKLEQDLTPGTNGAVLTLSNGKKIILERTKVGIISSGIKKPSDSLLVYNGNEAIGYNTLETPKGRQFAVVLPDGSKVWLNAASSLKYPTSFDKERTVELNGEAYFEVAHNSKMPFRVKSNKQITEDVGTSFNINAYEDEDAMVTTLTEGAITVNKKPLKPGQAAFLSSGGQIGVEYVNMANILAWKNGLFSFKKASINTVMRQFARWYDVEVVYDNGIPKGSITGSVYRNVNASQALQVLTYLNIHYRIEGKKIIITK